MSELRKIDDYSEAKENAEYRAKELKEASERSDLMWEELSLLVDKFNAETVPVKKQKIARTILALQKKLSMLDDYQNRMAIGIQRSLTSYDFGREELLNWKSENDYIN